MKDNNIKNKKIYIAGALFKQGDISERLKEEERLTDLGFKKVFNPISQPFNKDKTASLPTAKEIFRGDTQAILNSDIILAELDGEDSGTIMELGIAYGLNFMLEEIKKCNGDKKELETLLEDIPKKEIVAHLTDIRIGSSGEYDEKYVPFGYNQYVIGGIESANGKIYTDKEKMYKFFAKRIGG